MLGVWDTSSFSVKRTISPNDFKPLAVDATADGSLIGVVYEDDINRKFIIDLIDPVSGHVVYSMT